MSAQPDTQTKLAIDKLIRALVASGEWQTRCGLWVPAAANSQAALVNWADPAGGQLATVNAPTLVTFKGFTLDGTSQYLVSGVVPSQCGLASATNLAVSYYSGTEQANTNAYDIASLGTGAGQIDVGARATGNAVIGTLAQTTNSSFGSTFTSSVGLITVSRTGSTVTGYKDGVSQATNTAASSLMPDRPLYLGARNNVGTADKFATRRLAYVSFGAALTDSQVAAESAAISTYLLDVAPYVYVSNVSANGVPVGNDSAGDGSAAAPYLTLDAAYAAATPGQTILLNGSAASPADYRVATILTIGKAVNIDAVVPYGASVSATTTSSRVIFVNLTTGQSVRIGKVIVDGRSLNVSNVELATGTATPYTLTLVGTRLTGASTYGVVAANAAVKVNLVETGVSCSLALITSRSCLFEPQIAAGSITISGGSFTVADNNYNIGMITQLTATAAGVTLNVSDITATLTQDASYNSNYTFGIYANNLAATIRRNNITLNAQTSADAITISATATSPIESGGFQIANNKVVMNTTGGHGITAGQESATPYGYINGGRISYNDVSGSLAAQNGVLHGIFTGATTSVEIDHNNVHQGGVCLADKESNGNSWHDNVATDCATYYLVSKAGTNTTWTNNTANMTAAWPNAFGMDAHQNETSGNISTGVTFTGNTILASGLPAPFMTRVLSGSTASFSGNKYSSTQGYGASSFNYQGSLYPSCISWKASVETNAVCN